MSLNLKFQVPKNISKESPSKWPLDAGTSVSTSGRDAPPPTGTPRRQGSGYHSVAFVLGILGRLPGASFTKSPPLMKISAFPQDSSLIQLEPAKPYVNKLFKIVNLL